MTGSDDVPMPSRELRVSFGYQRRHNYSSVPSIVPNDTDSSGSNSRIQNSGMNMRSSSFSCLSGAALSANATLANTNICNGLIGEEILPSLDSPRSFRRMASSPSFSRLDLLPLSPHSSTSNMRATASASTESDFLESERNLSKSMRAPSKAESSSFLGAMDVQMAGGAAGEDRVQALCSEENGWLYCGVYDGFNGRDAADFLAGTLYENIVFHLHMLEWHTKNPSQSTLLEHDIVGNCIALTTDQETSNPGTGKEKADPSLDIGFANEKLRNGVLDCLKHALAQAESDFMNMVEQEMEDRPDLVSVGSCVLVILLHGNYLYVLNLGDSKAMLATNDILQEGVVKAIQLTESHAVDNESECRKLLAEHPKDPSAIINGKVKGKLKLTRAFGVGYLKRGKMNDVLMGILQVQDLWSPPYVGSHPFTTTHRVSEKDQFVVMGSDGLFDFFSNDEVVQLVQLFIRHNPFGDPAKHLIEQLLQKAADNAGFSVEELMGIPDGRRRKYHDDVTVIVIMLGNKQRTSSASTSP